MSQKLFVIVISVVLAGTEAFGLATKSIETFGNVNSIILELDYIDEITHGWEIESAWFEKVNTTNEIQAIIDGNNWYSHIVFKKWKELNPVSLGLWVLFYQEMPPQFDIGPPYIGFKGSFSTKNLHNLFITYFMYGTCSMRIYAEDVFIETIDNPCGKSCTFDFYTVKVPLNEQAYQTGKYNFRIEFSTMKPGDFLIIDRIQVDDIQLTTPTPCDCKPCDQILDNDSKESIEGWDIIGDNMEHFLDINDIEDALGDVLPPEFDYLPLEGAEGIWAVVGNISEISQPPSFAYKDDEFDYLEITCYLHNDSFLQVYIGDSTEPEILYNEEEEIKWSVFRVEMNGADQFWVEVNITQNGYFAFVDKIVARRSDCPVSESGLAVTTSPPEICICPTSPTTETSRKPGTRPTDETDEPEDTTPAITTSRPETESTGKPNATTTTDKQTTLPGGPNGESNLSNNYLLVLFLGVMIYHLNF